MSLFKARLLAEGVRAIEGESPALSPFSAKSTSDSFEQLLLERAATHLKMSEINLLFLHFNKTIKTFYLLFSLLLFILGGFAVQNMLFTDQFASVNFFWAFTLFFIPNLFMLLFWALLFFKPTLLESSTLYRFSLWGIRQFETRFNQATTTDKYYVPLFHCYFNILFGKQLGRYQLAKLTHLLWLSYFSGATIMSIAMLATHQVDFVWQTSILSSDNFQVLTQLLAYLPQHLGFPVPSIQQIQQSYLDANDLLDAENRRLAWSSLLISSLLLYGVLPRLLLFLLMSSQFKQKANAYSLDLSTPYYVQLRQLLKPNITNLGVTDTDGEINKTCNDDSFATSEHKQAIFPTHYYPIAIELSDRQFSLVEHHLLQCEAVCTGELHNICDYAAQQSVFATLKEAESKTVVIYVALNRLPDRGLKRFIAQLTALPGSTFHLAIIVESKYNKQRDSGWYQLANEVGIKLDNILHIEARGVKYE